MSPQEASMVQELVPASKAAMSLFYEHRRMELGLDTNYQNLARLGSTRKEQEGQGGIRLQRPNMIVQRFFPLFSLNMSNKFFFGVNLEQLFRLE